MTKMVIAKMGHIHRTERPCRPVGVQTTANRVLDQEKSILVQASNLLKRQKELRRLEGILEEMEKKEQASYGEVTEKEDKILNQWMT